jgi:hypothetical protein
MADINIYIKDILNNSFAENAKFNTIKEEHYFTTFPTMTYKEDRYKNVAEERCEDNTIYFIDNKDNTIEYKKKQGKSYFKDVNLSSLDYNDSDGTTPWLSYNYSFIKDTGTDNYYFIFVKSDDLKSEFGMKHNFMSMPHTIIFAGEMRIIKKDNKHYFQFNLNSSSFSQNEIYKRAYKTDLPMDKAFEFKKKLGCILKNILEEYKKQDPKKDEIEIQVFECDAKMNDFGHPDQSSTFKFNGLEKSGGYDPTDGLLYYYKDASKCPDNLNTLAGKVFDYNIGNISDPKNRFLLTPKISRARSNNNIIYVNVGDGRSIVLRRTSPDDKYHYEYNPKLTNLEVMDDIFLLFNNKDAIYLAWSSIGMSLEEGVAYGMINSNVLDLYNNNDLINFFNSYENTNCERKLSIIASPISNEYKDIKCWAVTQPKGSGASLWITTSNLLIKSYIIKNDSFLSKFMFWKEGWVSDYIQRKINSRKEITENFIQFKDIFQCPNKLPSINNPTDHDRCNELVHSDDASNKYGYIVMERVTNSIGDIDNNMFDCGCLFEYLYGKLVAKVLTGLIFTDQVNTGNCGYLNIDFNRKYTLKSNGKILDIYVKNNKMIKILDFDNFRISTTENNIYQSIDDIIPGGGGLFDDKNEFTSFDNQTDFFKNKINNKEKFNFVMLMYHFRKSFLNKFQINDFIDIIDKYIPQKYKEPPTDNRVLKEYLLEF